MSTITDKAREAAKNAASPLVVSYVFFARSKGQWPSDEEVSQLRENYVNTIGAAAQALLDSEPVAAHADNAALREALSRFGAHKERCACINANGDCDCGLD